MTAEVLNLIYHEPKDFVFLGGVKRLLHRARQLNVLGATRQTVQEYLQCKQANTEHMPARRYFTRNYIYVTRIDAQWQTDQADMQGIARKNGGMR